MGHWPVRKTSCLVLNFDVHTCRLISCVMNEAISWSEQYTICLKESKIHSAGLPRLCTYLSKYNADLFNVFSYGHLFCLLILHSFCCILKCSSYVPHVFHLDLLTRLNSAQRAYSFDEQQMGNAGRYGGSVTRRAIFALFSN